MRSLIIAALLAFLALVAAEKHVSFVIIHDFLSDVEWSGGSD